MDYPVQDEGCVVAVFFVVVVIGFLVVLYVALQPKPEISCADMVNWTVQQIPMRCYSYFGIQGGLR